MDNITRRNFLRNAALATPTGSTSLTAEKALSESTFSSQKPQQPGKLWVAGNESNGDHYQHDDRRH